MLKFKKIKKNDLVTVISGKDKGKSGKVIEVDRENGRVLVEGINIVKKSVKKSQQNPNGGFNNIESFLNISKVMVVCPKCKKETRIGFTINSKGEKKRICKKCKSEID